MYTTSSSGLKGTEKKFRENMIKSRIAETLIQELFLSLNYKVSRFGMENVVPEMMAQLRGVKNDVSKSIRQMPDFIVHNPLRKDTYLIEVKFRASGEFRYANLPENYAYPQAYIILVSKSNIKCLSVQELIAGQEIMPTCNNHLSARKEFDLDDKVITDFCKFAKKFFANV